ncbi:MAG: hypothetical protein KatS3mg087_1087 [Patescibacteria group bacterium]|nr:MAG: hypothetical protein KatS3mg087_1087 [Patescibacteria group bacterium]
MLEATVRAVKILDVLPPGELCSPRAGIIWPTATAYSSARGFFCWALPPSWYSRIVPLRPRSAAVILRVLPHETRGQPIEPPPDTALRWPDYVSEIPAEADVIVARNLVAVARAVAIERVIVRGEDYWPRLAQYAPVSICNRTPFPRAYVDDDSWLIQTDDYVTVLCGGYDSVAIPNPDFPSGSPCVRYSYLHAPRTCRGLIDRVTRILRSSASTD